MSGRFSLDGGMIPRSVKRVFDQRSEERVSAESQTAVLEFRGRKHVVRLVNISPSGAMIIFPLTPNIGEEMSLQLLDRAAVRGRVMWVRDGRIGVSFVASRD
ncbi:MAG TPA: PilZ domain-containing protein [Sphingomicrobium sp.]|nr:PilZ domain-containing protein [Sphingomicrobium sp.]